MTTKTNAQVIEQFMIEAGLQEVTRLICELPSGLTVTVVSSDDPFLNEPFQGGTRFTASISAEAGAPVKLGGDYWLVHQNDPDNNWPSDFHAHNQVRPETLDCYTGNIYNSITRKLTRKLRPKKLAAFLAQLPARLKR